MKSQVYWLLSFKSLMLTFLKDLLGVGEVHINDRQSMISLLDPPPLNRPIYLVSWFAMMRPYLT